MIIGRIQPSPEDGQNEDKQKKKAPQKVEATGPAVAIALAALAIVPPMTTAALDYLLQTDSGGQQISVQQAELKLKERAAEAEWIRAALTLESPEDRARALKFLIDCGLLSVPSDKISVITANPPRLMISTAVKP